MTASPRPLRVGLVGCGRIAAVHLRYLRPLPQVRVVALCDVDVARARAVGAEVGVEAVVREPAELLGLGLDAVHVLTPPSSHAETAIAALERGVHVLVEKPMATTAAAARRMQDAAAAAGRLLCVDHNRLFDPVVVRARAMVDAGTIGTVLSVEAAQGVNVQEGGPAAAPLAMWLNLAPHPLYLLRAFIGQVRDWQAFAAPLGELRAVLQGERALGYLCFSPGASPYLNNLTLHGTRGTLHLDLNTMTLVHRRTRPLPSMLAKAALNVDHAAQLVAATARTARDVLRRRVGTYPGIGEVVRRFHLAVAGAGPLPVTAADGTAVVELLEALWSRTHAPAAASRPVGVAVPARPRPASGRVVLVTGASGFLGRRVVAALVEAGHHVRAFVRFPGVFEGDGVEEVPGNLGDDVSVGRAVAGAHAVVHCAARVARRGSRADFLRENVEGTLHLLEHARAAGVARFVHVSSIAVYGVHRDSGPVAESAPYDPHPGRRGAYTESKLEADRVVQAAAEREGMRIVVLRPGILVGPDGPEFLARLRIGRIGGRLLVVGRGSQRLPLCHVDDVARAAALAVTAPDARGAYNVVDEGLTQDEWLRQRPAAGRPLYVPPLLAVLPALGLELLARVRQRPAPALSRYKIRRATESVRFDTARARRDLGWTPVTGVRARPGTRPPAVADALLAPEPSAALGEPGLPGRAS
jgi:nucleoside-diphosphate-sugar epimerase/predicted dehydrogenase